MLSIAETMAAEECSGTWAPEMQVIKTMGLSVLWMRLKTPALISTVMSSADRAAPAQLSSATATAYSGVAVLSRTAILHRSGLLPLAPIPETVPLSGHPVPGQVLLPTVLSAAAVLALIAVAKAPVEVSVADTAKVPLVEAHSEDTVNSEIK